MPDSLVLDIPAPLKSGATARLSLPLGVVVRVGCVLADSGPLLRVLETGWDLECGAPCGRTVLVKAMADLDEGPRVCRVTKGGYSLAWITLSDKGSRGERVDASGPLVGELVSGALDICLVRGFVLPDEELGLRGLLVELLVNQGFDLVVTTGGTGVAPRDVTPEATLAVIDKRLPGFERAMTETSLRKTPHGAISRAVAGTLGQGIVLNLPGSPKGVRECLEAVLPALGHTLAKLQGDPADCAAPGC